jgi:hypothetical protein
LLALPLIVLCAAQLLAADLEVTVRDPPTVAGGVRPVQFPNTLVTSVIPSV